MTGYSRIIESLARVTTTGRRIREIDGLRFLAISAVFIQHVRNTLVEYHQLGGSEDLGDALVSNFRAGVELFFVISGFILAAPFAAQHLLGERRVSLSFYYFRRVSRLEPPYILTLLLWYGVLVCYWGQSAWSLVPHFFASLFYVHNVVFHHFSTINSVAWSLEVEVQFYILAPFLAYVFLIKPAWLRRGVLIAGCVGAQLIYRILHRLVPTLADCGGPGGTLLNYIPLFGMGFLLADIYLTDWKREPHAKPWGDVAALVGWVFLPFYFLPEVGRYLPASTLPYLLFFVCWASFQSVFVRGFLSNSFVMTVGGMCYSIYLLHYPFLHILGTHVPTFLLTSSRWLNITVFSIFWAVPALIISVLFFYLVEKPCMQRRWHERIVLLITGKRRDERSA